MDNSSSCRHTRLLQQVRHEVCPNRLLHVQLALLWQELAGQLVLQGLLRNARQCWRLRLLPLLLLLLLRRCLLRSGLLLDLQSLQHATDSLLCLPGLRSTSSRRLLLLLWWLLLLLLLLLLLCRVMLLQVSFQHVLHVSIKRL
jgi:hypothetical protein